MKKLTLTVASQFVFVQIRYMPLEFRQSYQKKTT
jgi:hypothetical protein